MRYLGFDPSDMKPYYFISYNSEDDLRVTPVVTQLDKTGANLWYDYGIPYDHKWEAIIAERIFNSQAILLFYSNGIIQKEDSYVVREYKLARLYKKKIYVILLDEIKPESAPFSKVSWLMELSEHHTIVGTSGDTENICREILRAINWKAEVVPADQKTKVENPIVCNGNIVEEIEQKVIKMNSEQSMFSYGVSTFLQSIKPYILENESDYRKKAILDRMIKADQEDCFDVKWLDDHGDEQVNKGYCVQYNKALGPYRGTIRLHPSVDLGMIKAMCFKNMFRYAGTTYSFGSCMAGSDFDPRDKTDREMENFCRSFIRELCKYISEDADILHADIGVGAKGLEYVIDEYRKIRGVKIGDDAGLNPILRKEATGYGLMYITKALWEKRGSSLSGKTVAVSGTGNVGIYAIEKAQQLGAIVLACSDMGGWIYDPEEIDINLLKEIKEIRRADLSEYAKMRPFADYHKDQFGCSGIWKCKVDSVIACMRPNEISLEDAKLMVANSVVSVTEGANYATSNDAIKYLQENGVAVLGSEQSNIGNLILSYLKNKNPSLTAQELDRALEDAMRNVFEFILNTAEKYGMSDGKPDYVAAGDIVSFERIANAMSR